MFARIANRNVLFNAQPMLDLAAHYEIHGTKGSTMLPGYNKRKLIARIVLARIFGRPCRNSHICYVRDRWDKYLPWFSPPAKPIPESPLLLYSLSEANP